MVENIFKHNSRSYYDVYNAFVAAYPRKPTWLFEEFSGLIDFSSELVNRIATDIMYPITRESAYAFAARCDYDPTEADGATDTVTFTLVSAMTKTIPLGYQIGGISSITGEMVLFEVTTASSSGGTATITAPVKQQKTYALVNIGIVDNTDDFAEYPVDGYSKIIKSSATLTINSITWTRIDNFDASISTSKHFKLIYQSQGRARVQFGDGVNGAKPTLNSVIYMNFATTMGLNGRLDAGEIVINVGQDSDISSLTNAGTSGGNDAESIAGILRNARANARLRNMVWSQEDLETAARASSSSVQKAFGIPGVGAATIQIIPSGGGLPSSGLKISVAAYVQALTQFGAMPITALDPNYLATSIIGVVTSRTGFDDATVKNLARWALSLITSAIDNQVTEYYTSYGIDACRINVINALWPYAFVAVDNDALEFIILKWETLLGLREFREWGQVLEIGHLWVMMDDLYDYGLDVFNLTSPLSNVTPASNEIIDTDTITIT
jgi:hypothetical protein